ncbi:hypothetical protein TWF594_002579 [Orbilia oligospora]|nr:hypothetical protein TWF706_001432 [Orbilia oligospora]KAF3122968.1 hypothetical protein TWF594_002579 [Orbilia oligospora]
MVCNQALKAKRQQWLASSRGGLASPPFVRHHHHRCIQLCDQSSPRNCMSLLPRNAKTPTTIYKTSNQTLPFGEGIYSLRLHQRGVLPPIGPLKYVGGLFVPLAHDQSPPMHKPFLFAGFKTPFLGRRMRVRVPSK